MAFTYEFIDNGKSLGINFNGQGYTAGKNFIELIIPNLTENNVLKIRSNSAAQTEFDVNIATDTITGVGVGSTTATELRDALEAIFFLDDNVYWDNIEGDPSDNEELLDLINFNQSHTLDNVFSKVINHNLDRVVTVMLLDEDNIEFDAKVTHIDSNTIKINGQPPMNGICYIF